MSDLHNLGLTDFMTAVSPGSYEHRNLFFRSTGFGVGHLSSWREFHLHYCLVGSLSTFLTEKNFLASSNHPLIHTSVPLCLCWCFLQFSYRLVSCTAETHETSPCPVCRLWTGWVGHLSNRFCLLIGIPLRLISISQSASSSSSIFVRIVACPGRHSGSLPVFSKYCSDDCGTFHLAAAILMLVPTMTSRNAAVTWSVWYAFLCFFSSGSTTWLTLSHFCYGITICHVYQKRLGVWWLCSIFYGHDKFSSWKIFYKQCSTHLNSFLYSCHTLV